MTNKFGQVEVRKQRGKWIVQGMGQTNRGQKFIKKQSEIKATDPHDPKFKAAMAAAVVQLFDSGE